MDYFNQKPYVVLASMVAVPLALFLIVSTVVSGSEASRASASQTISVTGHGEVFAVPDIARISFSVMSEKKTITEAQKDVSAKVTKAIDALKAKGIAEKDIKTEGYNSYPKYEYQNVSCAVNYCPPGKQILVGYEVTQSISVKVRDVDTTGEIVDLIGASGITQISGPEFAIDDEDTLIAEAREQAIADAKQKARILSRQLHVSLRHIVSFSENGGGMPPIMYDRAVMNMSGAESAPAPKSTLPTGENKITSDVTITYEIR